MENTDFSHKKFGLMKQNAKDFRSKNLWDLNKTEIKAIENLWMKEQFNYWLISRNRLVNRPPRSCDMTPFEKLLNFYIINIRFSKNKKKWYKMRLSYEIIF